LLSRLEEASNAAVQRIPPPKDKKKGKTEEDGEIVNRNNIRELFENEQ